MKVIMWSFMLYPLLWVSSLQSELLDLLSTTDKFFHETQFTNNLNLETENLKLMVKRTYNLNDGINVGHKSYKRSIGQDVLIRDKQGIYLLSNIEDVVKIPVKFPNDINIVSSHNLLYIAALEANGSNPENQPANDLVLFQYSSILGIQEMGRVPVLGGTKIVTHSFSNVTYLISAERSAKSTLDSFQGSAIYKITEKNSRSFLEKIQTLNVIQPNDVKFWEHQDQLYLAVGTNMENDSFRTGVLIYRWLGYHFDCFQIIPAKNVKSVMPFIIGSFMYLSVANFQDEFENVDIDSEIYQFHLQEMKFKLFQKIRTHGAHDFSYFKFEDYTSRDSEHFLIVANSLTKNLKGTFSSAIESVVYKFSNNYFIPFQSFNHSGVTRWLPIQGNNGEFLLLAASSSSVFGYQYDGWRFAQISLQFGQSSFGENIQSMRTFNYFGDIFLTIADKISYGNKVNMWKLSFSNKNDLERQYMEIENWCYGMDIKLDGDNFDQDINEFNYISDKISKESEQKVPIENLKMGDFNKKMYDELEQLSEKAKILNETLKEAEKKIENFKNDSEVPIVIGSSEIASISVKCNSQDCCTFKNLQVLKLNGENLSEFLSDVIELDENLTDSVLEFEHVIVENNLKSLMVNGHPSETLVDISSNTFINAEFVVNGTVFINGDLKVKGLFNGVKPNDSNLLLNNGLQNIQEKLLVNSLRVKNLNLFGILNGESIENLQNQPEINLKNTYKELNVNNLFVSGLVGGYNLTQIFEEALRTSGNQEIQGDLDIISLEAEEINVDSNEISNKTISEIIDVYNEYFCQTSLNSPFKNNFEEILNIRSNEEGFENKESLEEYIVVVENLLTAKDISNLNNSISLLDIVNNSYKLNDSVIDLNFEFSEVVANDIEIEFINSIPVDSWVLKNSNEIQQIFGKKTFLNGIHIEEEVLAKSINKIDIEELERDVLKVDGDQDIFADFKFNTLTCHEIETNAAYFGNESFQMLVESQNNNLEIKGSVIADRLQVENFTIFGDIDSISWNNIVEDSVFSENNLILGKKTVEGIVRVKNLNISGRLNDLLFEEFMTMISKDVNKILLDRNVILSRPLEVEELHFEGVLDLVLKPNFEHEWLLQDETQIITAPIIFENLILMSGSKLMNETINNISLRKLFKKSFKINEDTKIKNLFTMGKVRIRQIDIEGTINGAYFNESIVQANSKSPQKFSGEWFFSEGLVINGSLNIDGHLTGLNLSHMCNLKPADKVNLIVGGSLQLKQEPKVRSKVNGIDLSKKMEEIWMKTEDTILKGQQLRFQDIKFDNTTTLDGFLNNVSLTYLSKHYLSKTQNRIISADFDFDQLIIQKRCRMHSARVGGSVNGINLTYWANNILLQDEEQVVEGRLRFENFQTFDLTLKGTVNDINLSKDVLRLDVKDAFVEGEKTFQAISVFNLTMERGNKLQGVDFDSWRENLIKTTDDAVIKGNLTLTNATFNEPLIVLGKVNNIYFDSRHLLTTKGNQVVVGVKLFDYQQYPTKQMKIRFFEVTGLINGINLNNLIKNQAYSNGNLIFAKQKNFTKGLLTNYMEVDGLFYGVNISMMCNDILHPIDINMNKNKFYDLLNLTETLLEVVKGRAFFFDYFELIQTLKPNIKAVVPTLDSEGNYLLAVFTSNKMRFMDWDKFSQSFANTDEGLLLIDNITFVTSEITKNSLLFIETTKSAKIFEPHFLKEIESIDTSCIASFQLKLHNKTCIFIGQKSNSSRILCKSLLFNDLQTLQWLDSKGSVQVTALDIYGDVYIAVINKEKIFDKIENTLSIYRYNSKLQHFFVFQTLAEVNPVALSSVEFKNSHFLVSAGGHLPESVHNSVLSIFKFNKQRKVFIRSQSIRVETPVDVLFAVLPSSQLALYVLTLNPTKPFIVFLHKGVLGFVEETSGLSLYPGSNLHSFTDSQNQHFVLISGFGKGQILKAGFKGDKTLT